MKMADAVPSEEMEEDEDGDPLHWIDHIHCDGTEEGVLRECHGHCGWSHIHLCQNSETGAVIANEAWFKIREEKGYHTFDESIFTRPGFPCMRPAEEYNCHHCDFEAKHLMYESTCLMTSMVLKRKYQPKLLEELIKRDTSLRRCAFCRKKSSRTLRPKISNRRITDGHLDNESDTMILLCEGCIQLLEKNPEKKNHSLILRDLPAIPVRKEFPWPPEKLEGRALSFSRINCQHKVAQMVGDPTDIIRFYGHYWALGSCYAEDLAKLLLKMTQEVDQWMEHEPEVPNE
jgi:hypothetical protein